MATTTTKTRRSRKTGADGSPAAAPEATVSPTATPDASSQTDTGSQDGASAAPDASSQDDAGSQTDTGSQANASAAPEASPASAPATTNTDHLKVVIVAGVLGDQPNGGMTGADVVTASGLQPGLVAKILAAMEVAGVARRLPPDEDGTERWIRGDGDLGAVDVANAPTHRTCPTCGHTSRISVNVGGRRNGSAEPGFNSDGQRKLRKGELYSMALDFVTSHPGHMFAAGDIARELGQQQGRTISSGAVQNALDQMLTKGQIVHANPDDPHDRKVTAPATATASG